MGQSWKRGHFWALSALKVESGTHIESGIEPMGQHRCLLCSYDEDGDGVALRFSSPLGGAVSDVRAKVVVGADGGFSAVRARCLGDGPPKTPVRLTSGRFRFEVLQSGRDGHLVRAKQQHGSIRARGLGDSRNHQHKPACYWQLCAASNSAIECTCLGGVDSTQQM